MGTLSYIAALATYIPIFAIVAWGLNIQFGLTGILNFSVMTFVAAGAYLFGVTSIGPSTPGYSYIIGWHLPFPIPNLIGGVAGGLVGLVFGLIALRRLRLEHQGIFMLVAGLVVFDVVTNYQPLFNGQDGLYALPQPFFGVLNMGQQEYQFVFLGICCVFAAFAYWLMRVVDLSPLGRLMRAVRDNPKAVDALGRSSFRVRLIAMVLGCILCAIGGGLLATLATAFNSGSWQTPDTFGIWMAMLVGGAGNRWGMLLGAAVTYEIGEGTRAIPSFASHPALVADLRLVLTGVVLILFLRFRPQGILPDRRPRYDRSVAGARRVISATDAPAPGAYAQPSGS